MAEIAKEAGVGRDAVRRAVRRLGLPIRDERRGRRLPTRRAPLPMEEIERLYVAELWPSHKLAERYGCQPSTILRRLRKSGVPIRHHNDTKRGQPARNRINVDTAAVVSAYRAEGATLEAVAASFGVSRSVITRVLREAGEPAKPPAPGRYAGAKNPRWRADLTPEEREKRRDMHAQSKWREKVYARDGFACQCCGDGRGGNLHAHHIEAHAKNKSARWTVSNGVTLCGPCHRAYHRACGLGERVNRTTLLAFIRTRRAMLAAA
ncbi:MAG: HNH endonuclease [Trueperaceae bacterium]